MTNKEKYNEFIKSVYVPIFSQPWWMDIVCGEDNWDVWLYEKNNEIFAAMPYYIEKRDKYTYITKAKLTQNNGLIIRYPDGQKNHTKEEFEEKIINGVMDYINKLGVDVYEQQFHYRFNNWIPFFWRNCTCAVRYTYVIEDRDIDKILNSFSSNYRKKLKKGQKNNNIDYSINYLDFYKEHEKIFKKQNMPCPFSFELWEKLYKECNDRGCGTIVGTRNENKDITSILFLVWDEEAMYQLVGGGMPEFSELQGYTYLISECIKIAIDKNKMYDFEGSVIKRINHSFREFGGIPKKYYKIRKIYNEEIAVKEAKMQVDRIKDEMEI